MRSLKLTLSMVGSPLTNPYSLNHKSSRYQGSESTVWQLIMHFVCIFNVFFCFLFFHNDFHIITNYGLRLLERIISGADLISIFFFFFFF